MALVLSRCDLESLLTMEEVMGALESGFKEMADGWCRVPRRLFIEVPEKNGVFAFMPAYLARSKAIGSKTVSYFPDNSRLGLPSTVSTYTLYDYTTGSLIALMDGTYITGMRTGAASGVATKYMAREDADTLAIIGTGFQAAFQLCAILCARPIKSVKVYNRSVNKAGLFAENMAKRHGLEITVESDPGACLKGSSIVVTCTSSGRPLFRGEELETGSHINAVGSFKADMRELDAVAVKRARLVVDSYEGAKGEAGEIIQAVAEGAIGPDHVKADLAEVVSGSKAGRTSRDEITLFKSLGMAMEDAVTAKIAYEKALELGIGVKIEL